MPITASVLNRRRAATRREIADAARDATRREIADAAIALFERDGYDAVSVEAIARDAGISLRTFYRYFTAKEDVLDPYMSDGVHDFVEAFARHPHDEDPLAAAVAAYAELADVHGHDLGARLVRVMLGSPALRSRWLDRLRATEEALVPHIRARRPEATDLEVRAEAGIILLALRLPLELAATGTPGATHEAALRVLLRPR